MSLDGVEDNVAGDGAGGDKDGNGNTAGGAGGGEGGLLRTGAGESDKFPYKFRLSSRFKRV